MEPLAAPFTAYVQRTTDRSVVWGEPARAVLPAYLDQRYACHWLDLDGRAWLAVLLKGEPEAPLTLTTHLGQLAERVGTSAERTCLVAEQLPAYLRRRLVELGQTFVIPGRQLFWPALGSAETVQRFRRLQPEPVPYLSPVAQQLLLALLLGRVQIPNTIRNTADTLGCTAMSVSRAVKELEGSGLIQTQARGRNRSFILADSSRSTWYKAQPLLRTPILQRLRILQADLPLDVSLRAGESALAALTDLTDPAEPAYAIASRQWPKEAGARHIPIPDAGTCVVELWRYPPETTAAQELVDPLSLFLSLQDNKDERVQMALEDLMERIAW